MTPTATPEQAISRRYATMVVAALSIVVLTCVAFLVPVPYVTMKPGPAFNTLGEFDGKPMFAFEEGIKTYPTTGTLDFTTVSVTRADTHMQLAETVRAYFDQTIAVVPKSLIYPDEQSAKASSTQSAALLASSKETSEAAALRAAGYEVKSVPMVQSVVTGGPSDGKLVAGDTINKVDGVTIDDPTAIAEAIGDREPGDTASITVTRDGSRRTVDITTTAGTSDKSKALIGITLGEGFDFPFKVINNVGSEIGGSSAGTMFALAIYDKLTPGALTGGQRVAGTGTIKGKGEVGPIGGIRQKMVGAAADNVEIFIVPEANCDEASHGDDFGMTLVKVSQLSDAISALEKLAENPKAEVPTCS